MTLFLSWFECKIKLTFFFKKRNECVRTPNNELIDQLYVDQLNWDNQRRKILNDQLKYSNFNKKLTEKSKELPLQATTKSSKANVKRSMSIPNLKKKFHF